MLLVLFCSSYSYADDKKIPGSKEEVMLSFAPLVKKASPAVVNIYSKKKVQVRSGLSPFLNDPVFQHFFGDKFAEDGVTERVESSLGSGVIVSQDGHIITNSHVIAGSTEITVVLSDRREFEAKVLVKDDRTDLALLKIAGDKHLPFLELMDSDKLEVGDLVVAIGNPFGVGQTVTSGIVSAVARTTVGVSDYQFFIQTDAAINPGNSGGALINMEGKLAGINSAIFTRSGGSEGVGFAIPANMVATVVRSKGDHIVRPWLGLSTKSVNYEIAKSLGMETPNGAIVAKIIEDSPAADAGLQVGDVIVAVDEHDISDEHSLNFRVATYEIGGSAEFKILRGDSTKKLKVDMKAAPEEPKRDARFIKGNNPLAGATVANISPALIEELGLNITESGVIITGVEPGVASSLGFHKNDIIKQINGIEITTTQQLEEVLKEKAQSGKITIKRGNRVVNVILNVR
ncbi:MAG: Do family serine endopeptidase [Rickettsiaceae bacterium]|nr:Do family serine endopeptidase [Rickettsiaceae bacterium]